MHLIILQNAISHAISEVPHLPEPDQQGVLAKLNRRKLYSQNGWLRPGERPSKRQNASLSTRCFLRDHTM